MDKSSNLLILFSILIIVLGSAFLLFGTKPSSPPKFYSSPTADPSQTFEPTRSSVNIEGERVLVTEVVDGDTIRVQNNEDIFTIRYLGVDTPETKDPRKPVQCFGKEAYLENKKLVAGKSVYLQKDVSETDKYSRLLRYVFLPLDDGNILFVNDYLIREGYARVLTIPPDVKYQEQFLEAQGQARIKKSGLWGKC